jgi:hypothetical protein
LPGLIGVKNVLGAAGFLEIIALAKIAAQLAKNLQLARSFNPFCNDPP